MIDYRGYRCSITYQEIHNGRSTLQADVGMGRMIPVPRSDVISLIRAEAKRQRREAKRRASLPVEPVADPRSAIESAWDCPAHESEESYDTETGEIGLRTWCSDTDSLDSERCAQCPSRSDA